MIKTIEKNGNLCMLIILLSFLFYYQPVLCQSKNILVITAKNKLGIINAGSSNGITKGEKYNLFRDKGDGLISVGIIEVIVVKINKAGIKLIESGESDFIMKNDILGDLYDDEIEEFFSLNTYPDNGELAYKRNERNPNNMDVNFNIKVGYFSPSEEAMKEIYGGGIILGGELRLWNYNGIGGAVGLEYFNKTGEPIVIGDSDLFIDISSKIIVMPFFISGLYKLNPPNSEITPFLGAGIGLYNYNEKIEAEITDYGNQSVAVSKNTIGFHFIIGMQMTNFNIEVKYTSANISTDDYAASGSEANIGGINFYVGIMF